MTRRAWPLVGRDEELSFIRARLRHPDARGLVLVGAAGVGKTRLARESLAIEERRGAVTRWAVGTAAARGMPLAAFSGVAASAGTDPLQLVTETAAALLDGPGRSETVVGVDDAHLLDDVSALLVHHLVTATPARVVLTVRTGTSAPDTLTRLWKERILDRVELQPLPTTETARLLADVLDGPIDSVTADRLWAMTQGNPLCLFELVEAELEAGRLHDVRGVWRWDGDPQLPPVLVEYITARMGRLSAATATVVDILALAEPQGVAELRALTSTSAVEVAEQRGLITVFPDGRRWRARLAHPLYGEARRSSLGHLRTRRLRAEIAAALRATGTRRVDDSLRLAVMAVDSDLTPDAAVLLEGAGRAAQLCDLPLAMRLAKAAVAAGGGFAAQNLVVNVAAGMAIEADVEYATLTDLATTDEEFAQAAVARVVYLAWLANDPVKAEAVALAAEGQVTGEARRRLMATRAYVTAWLARPRAALDLASSAFAAGHLPDDATAFASCARVLALGTSGRTDAVEAAARVGTEAANRSRDLAFLQVPLAGLQIIGMRLAGRPREALAIAERCRAEVRGMIPAEPIALGVVGEAELACGRVRSAIGHLTESIAAIAGYGGMGGFTYTCRLALVQAQAVAGDAAAAQAVLEEMLTGPPVTVPCLEPDSILARGWVSAALGISTDALECAWEAARLAAECEQYAHEVLALHFAARLGDGSGATRLRDLASQVDGPRAPAAAAHAAAVTADDARGLADASDAFAAMGDLLAAADAAAQAGIAHDRQGHRAAALAAFARARHLREECEGAQTPAIVAALHPLPVTDREREILAMAATGMTNRQIATRLVVSVRTVEGHLYRAGAKIGTTDRTKFAALLFGDATLSQSLD